MAITVKNIGQMAGSDIGDLWWGLWNGNYVHGTDGALAAGEDAGMGRFYGASDLTETVPDLPDVNLDSDQGVDGAVKGRPDAPPTAVLTGGVIDQVFTAAVSNLLINAEGPDDLIADSLLCLSFNPTHFVINKPGASREAGTYGKLGYNVRELLYATAHDKDIENVARGAQGQKVARLTLQHVDRLPWGEQVTTVKYGVGRLFALKTYFSLYPVVYHTLIGNGVVVDVTLDETPASQDGDGGQQWASGVSEDYTTDFTLVAATKTWTQVVAPASDIPVVLKYKYLPTC